ncbi:DUF1707 domain-containing protein [Kitasatospora sp. NPDC094016]|uniref:DUF1707 SHOCT-like domain-containing protein n=1 Tax=Kitasatospora sp. NPDC094016 TaxID=3154986 RepID=UPI00331939A0
MSRDLPALRASHQDRDRIVETLQVAAADGRLTPEELEARLESALSARTLAELAELTTDLPSFASAVPTPKDVLVIDQRGGKYTRAGRWVVPRHIELRPKHCTVVLDFTEAVITADTLLIDAALRHGKLLIISPPGLVTLDTDDLTLVFSKVKQRSNGGGDATSPRLRIEITGTLKHASVVARPPRRRLFAT